MDGWQPDRPYGLFELRFTRHEAELIRNDPLADDAITEQLRDAPTFAGDALVAMATPTDLDELLGSIVTAMNHCDDPKVQSRLERLYIRLEKLEKSLLSLQKTQGEEVTARSRGSRREKPYVFQLRIELLGVEPPIWRRIQIPSGATFWDLHVAIQDAMGWQDYHLHEFRFLGTKVRVGIPLDDEPLAILPGWELRVDQYLTHGEPLALYHYDFGDSWFHEVRFEAIMGMDARRKYPRCLAGARQCPPEDCGGIGGYAEFLEAISNSKHPEHKKYLEWVGGAFDSEAFDVRRVRFSDPKARLDLMLE